MNEYHIALAIIILVLILVFILPYLYKKHGWFKPFFHDVLLWHEPDQIQGYDFDGCSMHCICRYCKKDIMLDSQGNWF